MDDLPTLDSHAHVWDRTCEIIPGATYRPEYEATIDTYLGLLDAHGIEQAVLVQPSFLGTNNGYLLKALAAHRVRLRGIVVLDPSTSGAEMDDLTEQGVIGLRLNMMHATAPDPGRVGALLDAATARDWWIEVHAQGDGWAKVLPALPPSAHLMIDHFGRATGLDCPGLAALCRLDPTRACLKMSAPYRAPTPDLAPIATRLIGHFGAARCLWGSDWPWTQYEGHHSFAQSQEWFRSWTTPHDRVEMRRAAGGMCGF